MENGVDRLAMGLQEGAYLTSPMFPIAAAAEWRPRWGTGNEVSNVKRRGVGVECTLWPSVSYVMAYSHSGNSVCGDSKIAKKSKNQKH